MLKRVGPHSISQVFFGLSAPKLRTSVKLSVTSSQFSLFSPNSYASRQKFFGIFMDGVVHSPGDCLFCY